MFSFLSVLAYATPHPFAYHKPFFEKERFIKETNIFFLLAQVFFFRKKEKVCK
jgi:hypothetical protein